MAAFRRRTCRDAPNSHPEIPEVEHQAEGVSVAIVVRPWTLVLKDLIRQGVAACSASHEYPPCRPRLGPDLPAGFSKIEDAGARVLEYAIARNAAVRAFLLVDRAVLFEVRSDGARLFASLRNAAHFINDGHSVVVSSNNKGERPYLPCVVKRARKYEQKEEPHETFYDSGCRRAYQLRGNRADHCCGVRSGTAHEDQAICNDAEDRAGDR